MKSSDGEMENTHMIETTIQNRHLSKMFFSDVRWKLSQRCHNHANHPRQFFSRSGTYFTNINSGSNYHVSPIMNSPNKYQENMFTYQTNWALFRIHLSFHYESYWLVKNGIALLDNDNPKYYWVVVHPRTNHQPTGGCWSHCSIGRCFCKTHTMIQCGAP